MRGAGRPVIVGGVVLDIQVRNVPGGVGRNIAEGLARLLPQDRAPFLIGVVGNDPAGATLLQNMESLNMPTEGIRRCHDAATACVCAVLDQSGEVAAAVADMAATEQQLTPEWLQQMSHLFQQAGLVVLDANLAPASLEAACKLAAMHGVPILLEPVSVAKAARCAAVLQHAEYITPNAAELMAIADAICRQQHRPLLPHPTALGRTAAEQITQLMPALRLVLDAGVRHVALTLGAAGAALVSRKGSDAGLQVVHVPALPCSVASLTGAGDALVAGMAAALLEGCAAAEALSHGVAASSFAVESRSNVPQHMTAEVLRARTAQASANMTRLKFRTSALETNIPATHSKL